MNKVAVVILTLLVTGCAHLNSDFDCARKPGINCESLDSVNARIDRGEIGGSKTELTAMRAPCSKNGSCIVPISSNDDEDHLRKPLRYGEKVQRIWFAPFEDKQGNYHQESQVFSIVAPGHWLGNPVKEIDEDN